MGFGYIIWLLGLIFLVIGIVAGIGRWRLGRHGLLALLLTLQVVLAWFGSAVPAIGFFHPVNALLIFTLLLWIVHDTWRGRSDGRRRGSSRPSAGRCLTCAAPPRPPHSGWLCAAPPVSNGVVTPVYATCIVSPAAAWNRLWQWSIQMPGLSARKATS